MNVVTDRVSLMTYYCYNYFNLFFFDSGSVITSDRTDSEYTWRGKGRTE